MATYNRPGVYVEEVSSSFPVSTVPTATVATFMGPLVKGPTDSTLVSSWTQFTATFGDILANAADADVATAVYLFFANGGSQCYVQRVVVTMSAISSSSATTNTTALTVAAYQNLTTSDGGSSGTLAKGMLITGTGIPAGTTIASTVSSTSITLSQAASVPANTTLTVATPISASVSLVGNTTSGTGATLATQTPVGNAAIATQTPTGPAGAVVIATGTQAFTAGQLVTINGVTPAGYNGTWTVQSGTTTTSLVVNIGSSAASLGAITVAGTVGATGVVTLTTSAAHGLKVGHTVVIASTVASAQSNTSAYNGTFAVTAVPSSTTFTVANSQNPVSPITTAGTVTIPSATSELTLTAKNAGAWSNSLYYDVTSSTSSTTYPGKYFNLAIYSGGTGASNIVERFTDLTMLSTDANYAPTVINAGSNYITATDANAANHTAALFANSNTPMTIAISTQTAVSTIATSASTTVVLTADAGINYGMYAYGSGITNGTTVSSYVASTKTVTLSANATIPAGSALTFTNTPFLNGSDGTTVNNTAVAATSSLAKLDAITSPILLNAPGVTELANVNNLLTYAYNRGDVFVIIDPTQATTDSTSQLALANTYTGGSAGASALGSGAVYYPNLTIPSPTSSVPGATVTAYPGGAVAAKFVTTDASRGVFKSPAGLEARLSGVVSVPRLTNQELDNLNNGSATPNTLSTATPINAIRYIPGSGIVVMGARTLNTSYQTKYISVRRSLIYLRKTLTDLTSFAIFETNDQRLWNRLQTTCEAALISFWQSGGLKGANASDAFFVKCDNVLNTTASIAAGEVHLEIGVALQRPAEFVVIRISQYDSGSVVTVL